MTDKQIIDELMAACQFAEATLLKMSALTPDDERWKMEAVGKLGKAMANTEKFERKPIFTLFRRTWDKELSWKQ